MSHLRVSMVFGFGAAALALACASPHTTIDGAAVDRDAGLDATVSCMTACARKGQACSLGRCTSAACQDAEASPQNIAGCLFYTLQADNVTADEGAETTFLVTNLGVDPTNVQLEVAQATSDGTTWVAMGGRQIAPGKSASLPIAALEVTAAGLSHQAALRISSDRPVTVAEIESDDLTTVATSSGGTMVLPLQVLVAAASIGSGYQAVTYPQHASPDVMATYGSRGGAARVMIVGTHQGTRVTFTTRTSITDDPSGSLTIDDGDVVQIYTGAEGEDLTGSTVTADQPVAVFSGNISTTYGSDVTGINSADLTHEQMPPVSYWSRSWVAAALTPQASVGCTSFFGGAGGSIWEVIASKDGTEVTVSAPGMPDQTNTLAAGVPWTIVQPGSFFVHAKVPILVTQGMDCEASLSLAVAVDGNLFKSLPFAVPPAFDLLLGVVRPTGAPVDLDGMHMSNAMFRPAGGGFEVAAVPLGSCIPTDGSGACTHQLSSPMGFGLTLRGMDVGSSFALTPPLLSSGCGPDAPELCVN
jgi:IgGFc binding protein